MVFQLFLHTLAMLDRSIHCLIAYPTAAGGGDDIEHFSHLEKRTTKVGGITLHQVAMTLLLAAHRSVMDTGFTSSRLKPATDVLMAAFIGGLTMGWAAVVTASGHLIGEKLCRQSVRQ